MKIIIREQNIVTLYVTTVILVLAAPSAIFNGSVLVQYFDEIFTVFATVQLIFQFQRIKVEKDSFQLAQNSFFVIFGIVILGLVSNSFSRLIHLSPILIDLLGMIKAPIIFLYCLSLIRKQDKITIQGNLLVIAKFFVTIVFFTSILHLFVDIGMTFDIRYGLRSFRFIYANPGGLNIALFVAYVIIITQVKSKFSRQLFGFFSLVPIILTFRGIGVGTVGIILMLKVYAARGGFNKKLTLKDMIPLGLGGVLLGYGQLKEYFIGSDSIRSILLRNAIVVMTRYFPIGSGFATYGSDQAFKNYSRLYYEFGYHYIYYLSPGNGAVANDNFWPMLIAQFGIIAVFLYLYLLYAQLKYVLTHSLDDKYKVAAIALLSFLFITSLGNAVYTSASGVLAYIMTGLMIIKQEKMG
ncbi:hypothetical protein GGG87_09055 [Streptococcus sp. zg-86]|uniref:Oligosaccharide repeat unit polymerase n=1 Tax=Streptococcus zhangguiae TaxID=2664091 RepID=A0A6I4RC78_9STRE|nr:MULTISPECIES: hypothetical protein [unclassified Streptococcus]MTB65141.1 hypothetical protein [Streptococcus sp. zg-86]MTB91401.1 hypothetical protein [Streptococcus sp. zg-36]MWV57129.1 hypothetical protein [Streptococcus sp. zg-70]QTH47135.1 hypothetical protein J5M87_06095 [Streptococcus sp. zg-86]